MLVDRAFVSTIFAVVSITGPIFGVVFGGFISSKFGGYNHPKSMLVTAAVSVCAVLVSGPAGFIPSNLFYVQVFLLWCLLFTGGFMVPNMTGMMLNTVDEHLKTSANSLANLAYNIFGFLPSPFVYGAIADIGPVVGGNKRMAMQINLLVPVLASAPVVYHAICFQRR